ncbi:hypothetical protein BST33_16940 [Mycolicibacter minnesotensis]|uniref:HTH tetR-type domain-containing protein n=1 Tax=Mycolicibacter minnesotensis TaxID=1118379 RepID=A0AA91M2U7_9MYCO|nr:hypothetical protein BST33_16940 [Mycolicibacter minnesotensis]
MVRSGPAQQRARIVLAARQQAVNGYASVHIRSVADSAGVSPTALYQHFSSKDDLLVYCLHSWLDDFKAATTPTPSRPADPYRRLQLVVDALTERMSSTPRFADTVARAYLHAVGSAARGATLVRETLIAIFVEAVGDPNSPDHEHLRHVAALVADVWITNILAIAQNRTTPEELQNRLSWTISAIRSNSARQSRPTNVLRQRIRTS